MDPAPGHNPVSESHDLIQNAICWSNFYNFRMHSPYLDHKQLSFTKCHFYHLASNPDVLFSVVMTMARGDIVMHYVFMSHNGTLDVPIP